MEHTVVGQWQSLEIFLGSVGSDQELRRVRSCSEQTVNLFAAHLHLMFALRQRNEIGASRAAPTQGIQNCRKQLVVVLPLRPGSNAYERFAYRSEPRPSAKNMKHARRRNDA